MIYLIVNNVDKEKYELFIARSKRFTIENKYN